MMDQIEKPIPMIPRIEPVMIIAAVIWLILIRQLIWCVDYFAIRSIFMRCFPWYLAIICLISLDVFPDGNLYRMLLNLWWIRWKSHGNSRGGLPLRQPHTVGIGLPPLVKPFSLCFPLIWLEILVIFFSHFFLFFFWCSPILVRTCLRILLCPLHFILFLPFHFILLYGIWENWALGMLDLLSCTFADIWLSLWQILLTHIIRISNW